MISKILLLLFCLLLVAESVVKQYRTGVNDRQRAAVEKKWVEGQAELERTERARKLMEDTQRDWENTIEKVQK